MSYLPVLRALADGQSLSQTELAQLAGVESPSMGETLVRMQRDGVVQRERNPNDRRANLFSVTREARARFAPARSALMKCERRVMAGFGDAEQALLRDLLKRIVDNLDGAVDDLSPAPTARGRSETQGVARARKSQHRRSAS